MKGNINENVGSAAVEQCGARAESGKPKAEPKGYNRLGSFKAMDRKGKAESGTETDRLLIPPSIIMFHFLHFSFMLPIPSQLFHDGHIGIGNFPLQSRFRCRHAIS